LAERPRRDKVKWVRRLILYKTGATDPQLLSDIGDYERWFRRILGEEATLEIHGAIEAPSHRLSGYDGVVISGSPRSLAEPEPWMDDAAAQVRAAADAGVPVLGVCFGHQLIGYAFGGQVRVNPNGWEAGTHAVELTDEGARDQLFAGLPRRLHVNQSHRDEVWQLGDSTRRLAASPHTPTQAIAVGAHVRGVQFHPEMNAVVVRRILCHRRHILDADAQRRGRAPVDQLLGQVADCPDGEGVLRNFVAHFVKAA
jgi:GMP synthase (glutamine-hydrolysing)